MYENQSLRDGIEAKTLKIAVVGLGYVGMPLAVAFGRHFKTVGYDVSTSRIDALNRRQDVTGEVSEEAFSESDKLSFSDAESDLAECDVYVVAVPTPFDDHGKFDDGYLVSASMRIGRVMKKGALVVYESTVYPGCTEEVCIPVLEKASGLKLNEDFFVGYSPERINPGNKSHGTINKSGTSQTAGCVGDKGHTLESIVKVVSGSCHEAVAAVDALYRWVVKAGTCPVSSIRVAEAVKSVENAQRDVNIAFANEVSTILGKMGIDTQEVLNAAATKWNFLNFRPGLVGGYCIPNASGYLSYKVLGDYRPEVLLACRRHNAGVGKRIAQDVIRLIMDRGMVVKGAVVRIFGCTFKENCPEVRSSCVFDIVKELQKFNCRVQVVDPHADPAAVKAHYGVDLMVPDTSEPQDGMGGCQNDAVNAAIVAVAHDEFKTLDFGSSKCRWTVVYDVKGILPKDQVDGRL